MDGTAASFLHVDPVGPQAEFAAFAAAAGETWDVDLLIGEVSRTGQGLGSAVIRAFLMRWQAARRGTLPLVLIDPGVRTVRAVRACKKAGFCPLVQHGAFLMRGWTFPRPLVSEAPENFSTLIPFHITLMNNEECHGRA